MPCHGERTNSDRHCGREGRPVSISSSQPFSLGGCRKSPLLPGERGSKGQDRCLLRHPRQERGFLCLIGSIRVNSWFLFPGMQTPHSTASTITTLQKTAGKVFSSRPRKLSSHSRESVVRIIRVGGVPGCSRQSSPPVGIKAYRYRYGCRNRKKGGDWAGV